MTRYDRQADVVIIGLGAAGGIAADVLCQAGRSVVALEAGPRRTRAEATVDEIQNEIDAWLCEPKAAAEAPTFRAGADEEARGCPHPVLVSNGVGGGSLHYPGTSPRLAPWNFRARSETLRRYGTGAIPPETTLVDWPLDYVELEPFYDRVERAIGVSGAGGNIGGARIPGGNPFEGDRRRDYPMPPLRRTGWTEVMTAAASRLGWHPFPTPAAINSVPFGDRPACTYCGFCENNLCHNGARGSTAETVIRSAEASGRLAVLTGARALRVELDREGRACGVAYTRNDRAGFQPAAAVLLAAHGYENVRLLLLSDRGAGRGRLDPNARLGVGFMPHINPEVCGLFPGLDLKLATGSWAQGVCVDDWNADNFEHEPHGFISGGMLTTAHELLKPIALSQTLPEGVPRWGAEWKAWLARHARSVGVANAQLDVLPYRGNTLDLDPSSTDSDGIPRVRITFRAHERERRAEAFLISRLREWLSEAGASSTWVRTATPAIEARTPFGGTTMGDDSATSVVDRFGFMHSAPNLGVLGSSTFPTAGGCNPTLTIQALAWRTVDRLIAMA